MTPRTVRLSLVALLFATAVFRTEAQPPPAPPPAGAQPAGANDPLVDLKLADESVDQVLSLLTIYTGRAVIRPSNGLPPGTYTIDLKRIRRSEAINALESILSLNGIAVTPMNDRVMYVTPLLIGKTVGPEMITGSTLGLPRSGKIATKVFQLEFLRIQEFNAAILGLLNPQLGGVSQFPSANALMITDTVTTLQRIEELINQMDKPGPAPKFVTLKNGAKASDVVNKMRLAFGNTIQQQLGNSTFSADDRSNKIIIMADPRLYPLFDDLIANLDVKADPNTLTDVIPLKHADATKVQELLSTLISKQASTAQRSAAQSVRAGQGNFPGQQITFPAPQNNPIQPGGVPIQPGGGPNSTAQVPIAPPTQNQIISGIEGAAASAEFSSIINVVNDPRANSIIVSGTVDDVRLIKDLIAKIDTMLPQVRIEVIIAEVTLSDTDMSGISKLNLTFGTDTPAGPGGDNGRGTHITNFAGTIAGWDVTSGIVNPLSFAAAFSDAGRRSNLKVLQAPTIVTTHAKQGEVIVGSEIPYVTSASSNTANSDVQNRSTAFKTINLDLKVTPLIGDDGSIQLDIDQLIQDQIGSVDVNGSPTPQVGTRHVTSFVNVFDNQMIVLGGLQRTSVTNAREKLGFIFELPILSRLLGGRTFKTERTELLLFIRPHVLKPEDGTADANKSIETLSNKDQVKQYLQDPGKRPKESLLERVK